MSNYTNTTTIDIWYISITFPFMYSLKKYIEKLNKHDVFYMGE